MKKSLALVAVLLITIITAYAQDQKPTSTDTYTDEQGRLHVVRNYEKIIENNYKKTCKTDIDETEDTEVKSKSKSLTKEDIYAILEEYFAEKKKEPGTTQDDVKTMDLLKKSVKLQKIGLAFNVIFGATNVALGSANLAYSVKNNKLMKGLQSKLSTVGVGTIWTLPGSTGSTKPTDFGVGTTSTTSTTSKPTTQWVFTP